MSEGTRHETLLDLISQVYQESTAVMDRASATDAPLNRQTVLLGDQGRLDSLAMVHFLVGLEQRIEADYHISLPLTEQATTADEADFLRDVGQLLDHLERELSGRVSI